MYHMYATKLPRATAFRRSDRFDSSFSEYVVGEQLVGGTVTVCVGEFSVG